MIFNKCLQNVYVLYQIQCAILYDSFKQLYLDLYSGNKMGYNNFQISYIFCYKNQLYVV